MEKPLTTLNQESVILPYACALYVAVTSCYYHSLYSSRYRCCCDMSLLLSSHKAMFLPSDISIRCEVYDVRRCYILFLARRTNFNSSTGIHIKRNSLPVNAACSVQRSLGTGATIYQPRFTGAYCIYVPYNIPITTGVCRFADMLKHNGT